MNVKTLRRPIFLLSELVRRDVRSRYVGSMFGMGWAVIAPLAWVVLYSFVFSVVLRIPLTGEPRGVNFPEFLLAAFLPWMAVSEGISRAATCLSDNAAMVKKAVFPKETLVATVVLTAAVAEIVGLSLYTGYLAFRGHLSIGWALLALPLVALQLVLAYGLGCVIACLNVFVRDTAQFVGLTLAMLAFATPIFYPASAVPAAFRWVLEINPFAHLVEAFRSVFFRHTAPGWGSIAYLTLFTLVSAAAGSALFSKAEPHFADLL
jgi:lipopolysaccharide transport system permease protein